MRREKNDTMGYLFSNRDLRRLILPLLMEQLLSMTVGLADSIMVAYVGEAAVSAVSLVDTVMLLMINLFTALATGGAIVVGQYLGRKRNEDACRSTEQLLLVCGAVALVVMAGMYISQWVVIHIVFGKIELDVMANCQVYYPIVTASIPLLALYNAGAAVYRAMGDSRTPMLMSLTMNAVNLTGNAVLLYGLKWGIEGAAIPTLLSRCMGGIWMLVLLRNRKKQVFVSSYRAIHPDHMLIRRILRVGLPYGVENSMFQLGKIVLLSLVSSFGTSAITANAVGNTVNAFAVLGGNSVGLALSAVAAQCVGAGDYRQVRYYTRKMMFLSYVGIWVMNLMVFALLPVITAAYRLTPETARLASQLLILNGLFAMAIWPFSWTLPIPLRSSSDTAFCMATSFVTMWVFRIGASFVLAKLGLGVTSVWLAMFLDWGARSVEFVLRYRGKAWQTKAV